MSWVVTGLGMTAANTALGAVQANQNRKAQQKMNQANAEISAAQTQYSPWTGIKGAAPDMKAAPDNTAGAIGRLTWRIDVHRRMSRKPAGMDPDMKEIQDNMAEGNFKMDQEDQNWLNSGPKPLSPTTAPTQAASSYVPMMSEMDREDDLSKFERNYYLPKKPRF